MKKQYYLCAYLTLRRILIVLVLFVSFAENGLSQSDKTYEIKGVVIDGNTNDPIIGATILVENTSIGAATDIDGNFTLNVPESAKTITVSYIGFTSRSMSFSPQRLNDFRVIQMFEDSEMLDEVTIVAFGKQKKESVIASIETVRPSELKVPSSNLTTALAGRMSGVISYQRSGEPGQDNAEFFIRGITSFGTGKKDPLILIDNVELTSNDLSRLNPDDLESFSILKDATATALYGARGANGVILVTTKEGQSGKTKVSIRFENSFSTPTQKVKVADPITFMEYHNEAVRTRDPQGVLPYSNTKIANTKAGVNPYMYPTVDWLDLLTKDVTSNQRLNFNVSGGGNVVRYYLAGSFSQDNGVLKVDDRNNFNSNIDLKKYLLRSNVNIKLSNTTEGVIRMHGTFDDYTGPIDGGGGIFNKALKANPVMFPAYYKPDKRNEFTEHILFGNAGMDGDYLNPYADMVKGYKDYSSTVFLAQLELEQDISAWVEGLRARLLVSTTRDSYFDVTRNYGPFYYSAGNYDKSDDTYVLSALNPNSGHEYLTYDEGGKRVNSSQYLEASLIYNNTFNDRNTLSGMMVFTGRESLSGNAGDLQSSLPFRNLGLAGRFTYDYDSRYFGEFNFGYNGSERFDKNNRFGFFPSAGIGWSVSNEDFWTDEVKEVVSRLRLKATYGLVGNDQIGRAQDRFFYLSNVNLDNDGRGYSFGTNYNYSRPGVSISRYADPDIGWEVAYKTNIGLELGLFDNKIEIQADYFTETRENILQERADIPTSMGLQVIPVTNIGEAKGHGVDISLDYNHFIGKDFWITSRSNFTFAESEFKFYEEPDYYETPWRSRIGQSLGQEWGYVAERLFVDEEEVRNSPPQFGEYLAGDIKYKDINGDGVIDERDQVPIGHPTTPKIIYGFGASMGYKEMIDFSFFFQGSALSSFWIDYNAMNPFSDTYDGAIGNNALSSFILESHWSEENRDLYATWPRLSTFGVENNGKRNTWFMRDGSFLRLKSVEVGFSFPENWIKRYSLERCRFYLSGTNLLTFSAFSLWDPEMGGNGLGYPVQRVINAGLQISF